ncbi:Hypothetical protein A7982_04859 [Minicystis rosea]|nr:Hypothetical protein A7982_04859 [Minicystis rosea]
MRFHPPSFLLGVGLTSAAFAARGRLRPVIVEISALGVHLARLGHGLVERQRESLEDLWAEVEDRVRERSRVARTQREAQHMNGHRPYVNGPSVVRN